jgi:hypothetical protein
MRKFSAFFGICWFGLMAVYSLSTRLSIFIDSCICDGYVEEINIATRRSRKYGNYYERKPVFALSDECDCPRKYWENGFLDEVSPEGFFRVWDVGDPATLVLTKSNRIYILNKFEFWLNLPEITFFTFFGLLFLLLAGKWVYDG